MKISDVGKRQNSSQVEVDSQVRILNIIFISYKTIKTCIHRFAAAGKVLHFYYVFSSEKFFQTKMERHISALPMTTSFKAVITDYSLLGRVKFVGSLCICAVQTH